MLQSISMIKISIALLSLSFRSSRTLGFCIFVYTYIHIFVYSFSLGFDRLDYRFFKDLVDLFAVLRLSIFFCWLVCLF